VTANRIIANHRLCRPTQIGVVTVPLWFFVVAACTVANNHVFRGRVVVLTALGAAIFVLLGINIRALYRAILLNRSASRGSVAGIVINAVQVGAIVALLALGLFWNASV